MPYIDPFKQKEFQHKEYLNHRERYRQRARDLRKKKREYIARLKEIPCMDCGMQYPHYVMQFDHRDQKTKVGQITYLINTVSWKTVLKEITKCDIICANCHRKRTYLKGQHKDPARYFKINILN